MSQIKINITDNQKVLTGEVHGSVCDSLVASLAAEPETIGEFKMALKRFERSESDRTLLGWLTSCEFEKPESFRFYLDLEPYDAGVMVIDLAGKTVAVDSTYSSYSKEGSIRISDELAGLEGAEFELPFRLSDDWEFVCSMPEYEGVAGGRRKKRSKHTPVDARAVFYGEPLLKFMIEEMRDAVDLSDPGLFREIHAKWLMTRRKDLVGETPRGVLLEKREFIDFDLQNRALQWSFTKKRPPDLPRSANAYKFAGFGTGEIVVYYDLVRSLLAECLEMSISNNISSVDDQVALLANKMSAWLNSPNREFSGRVPAKIVDSERARRNLTVSPQECLIDDDCPICVEMSKMFDTPGFWYLDGCNMDDGFEFSFYKTRAEWKAEQKRIEEFNREFEKRYGSGDHYSVIDEDLLL